MPSNLPIQRSDLARLARLAAAERKEYFDRHPEWAAHYRTRVLFTILCDEAANHYGSGISGFTNFRLHTFYVSGAQEKFPRIRRSCVDFGASRHAKEADAASTFVGRRVWIESHPIAHPANTTLLDLIQGYLKAGATSPARRVRINTVVFVEPKALLGLIAWPTLVVTPRGRRRA